MSKLRPSYLFFVLLLLVGCESKNTYYQTPNNGFSLLPYWGVDKADGLVEDVNGVKSREDGCSITQSGLPGNGI